MDELENTMIDIDNLAKKIEERLTELESKKDDNPSKEEIDKTIYDFGDLLNQIEAKIKEIEEYEKAKEKEKIKKNNEKFDIENSEFVERILERIDEKMEEIENEEFIAQVTEKVNNKLNYLLEFNDENELEKTLYDLSEISKLINETVAKLEKDKLKKEKKAKYCAMARKKERDNNRKHAQIRKNNRKTTKKQG